MQLTVVRGGLSLPPAAAGEVVVSDNEVRRWLRDGRLLRHVGRYDVCRLVTERLSTSGRPMLLWALRLTARRCYIVDREGRERPVTFGLLVRWSWAMVGDLLCRRRLLRRIRRDIGRLAAPAHPAPREIPSTTVLYLRTDLAF